MCAIHSDTTENIHIHIDTLATDTTYIFIILSGGKGTKIHQFDAYVLCFVFFVRFQFDHIQITKSEYAWNAERYVRKRERNIHRQNSIIIETRNQPLQDLITRSVLFSLLFLHIVRV